MRWTESIVGKGDKNGQASRLRKATSVELEKEEISGGLKRQEGTFERKRGREEIMRF